MKPLPQLLLLRSLMLQSTQYSTLEALVTTMEVQLTTVVVQLTTVVDTILGAVVTTMVDTILGAVVTTMVDTTLGAVVATQRDTTLGAVVTVEEAATQVASVLVIKAPAHRMFHRLSARFHRRILMRERTLFSNTMLGHAIEVKAHLHSMVLNALGVSESIQGEPITLLFPRQCKDSTVKDAR